MPQPSRIIRTCHHRGVAHRQHPLHCHFLVGIGMPPDVKISRSAIRYPLGGGVRRALPCPARTAGVQCVTQDRTQRHAGIGHSLGIHSVSLDAVILPSTVVRHSAHHFPRRNFSNRGTMVAWDFAMSVDGSTESGAPAAPAWPPNGVRNRSPCSVIHPGRRRADAGHTWLFSSSVPRLSAPGFELAHSFRPATWGHLSAVAGLRRWHGPGTTRSPVPVRPPTP